MEQNILNEILTIVKRTQEEVTGLKVDVAALKEDVTVLKEKVLGLEIDVSKLKENIVDIREYMDILEQEIKAEISSDIGKVLIEMMQVIRKVENEKKSGNSKSTKKT